MKFSLVIAGGGGAGGYSAGVSYELRLNGVIPSVIHGISVGALNGFLIATGKYETMRDIWHTVVDDDVRKERKRKYAIRLAFHKIGVGSPYTGYWSNEPLKALVRKHIINTRLECDYYCGAVRIRDSKFVHFHFPKYMKIGEHNVDGVVDKIVASTAIPMIFEPVTINGDRYVDGGVHYQMPLKQAIKDTDKSDYIIAISHNSGKPSDKDNIVRDDIDMTKWTIGELLTKTNSYDFEQFERINHMCKNGITTDWDGTERKYYPSTIFRPTQELSPSTRFHHYFGAKDFEHGRQAARGFAA